jgi:hypothetical protein
MKTQTKKAKTAQGAKAKLIESYKWNGEEDYNKAIITVPRYGFSLRLLLEYFAKIDDGPNLTDAQLENPSDEFFKIYLTNITRETANDLVAYINANI